MEFLFNNTILKERRKELRQRQTVAEKKLWEYLRNKKTGRRFLRQYSVGYYILDFYCPQKKLGIELDGDYHNDPDQRKYDQSRDHFLTMHGIKILRFTNNEVVSSIEDVLEKIKNF